MNINVFFRQCALAALRDVKSYLKDEGGQVAVNFPSYIIDCLEKCPPLCELMVGIFVTKLLYIHFRSSMPPTQQGTGERWSSSLVLRTTSRFVFSRPLEELRLYWGSGKFEHLPLFLSRFSSSSLCVTTLMWLPQTSWWVTNVKYTVCPCAPCQQFRTLLHQLCYLITSLSSCAGSEGVVSRLPGL